MCYLCFSRSQRTIEVRILQLWDYARIMCPDVGMLAAHVRMLETQAQRIIKMKYPPNFRICRRSQQVNTLQITSGCKNTKCSKSTKLHKSQTIGFCNLYKILNKNVFYIFSLLSKMVETIWIFESILALFEHFVQ